jgi:hypothetical protein
VTRPDRAAAGGLEIAVLVPETDHAVAVSDIDPLRVRPEEIEGNAERLLQPAGKYRVFLGAVWPAGMRNTCTVPNMLSATNKSPLGATRITRGLCKPDVVTSSAAKPSGTCGRAPAGIATTSAGPSLDFEMAGRSCGVSRRLTPGLSSCQLPMAASPCNTWPNARSLVAALRQQATMATIVSEYPLMATCCSFRARH